MILFTKYVSFLRTFHTRSHCLSAKSFIFPPLHPQVGVRGASSAVYEKALCCHACKERVLRLRFMDTFRLCCLLWSLSSLLETSYDGKIAAPILCCASMAARIGGASEGMHNVADQINNSTCAATHRLDMKSSEPCNHASPLKYASCCLLQLRC